MNRVQSIFFVAAVVLFARSSHADLLVSNLNETRFPSLPVVQSSQWLASSFITGSSAAEVTDVTFVASTGGTSGAFQLAIYASVGGLPGSPVANGVLSGSTAPNGPGNDGVNFHYTPTSTLTLAANTRYWLVASATTGVFTWKSTASFGQDSAVGWTIEDYDAFSTDSGASWVDTSNATRPLIGLFAIDGTLVSVPEPSTAVLMALGLVGVAIGRRTFPRR